MAIRNVFPVPSVKTRIFHRRTFMDSSWRISLFSSLNFLAIYDARVNYPLIGCVPIHSEFEIEKNVAAVFVLFFLFDGNVEHSKSLVISNTQMYFRRFCIPIRLRIIMSWLMIWIHSSTQQNGNARCPCTIHLSRHEFVEPVVSFFALLLLLLSQLFHRFQLFRHQ